jgi:hypothetical protein
MDAEATRKLIGKVYDAWASGERGVLEAALADRFTFTSPYDDHIDRAIFFTRCWPNHEQIKAIHIDKLIVRGQEAFVLYTCELKSGERFRNVEYLTFDGAKLKSVEVYFGDPPSGVSREEYLKFLSKGHEAWRANNA